MQRKDIPVALVASRVSRSENPEEAGEPVVEGDVAEAEVSRRIGLMRTVAAGSNRPRGSLYVITVA